MPVYESIKNADNKIKISAQNKDSFVFGCDKVIAALGDTFQRVGVTPPESWGLTTG